MLAAITSGLDLNLATMGPTYMNTGPTTAAEMPSIKDTVTKDDNLGHFKFTNRFEQLISKNTKRKRRSDTAPYQGYLCSHQGQILTIFQNGTVGGTPMKNPYSPYARIIFEHIVIPSMLLSTFVPTKPSNGAKIPSSNCNLTKLPLFQLKGEKSKFYVCMNHRGNLYSSQNPEDPSECRFMREYLSNRFVTYKSCKYPEDRSTDYLIALRRDGKTYSGSNHRLTNSTSVHNSAWFLEKTHKKNGENGSNLNLITELIKLKGTTPKPIEPTKKDRKGCKDKIRHSKKCRKDKSRTKKCKHQKRMERKCKRRGKGRKKDRNHNKGRPKGNKKKNRKNRKNRRRQRRTSTTTATLTRS